MAHNHLTSFPKTLLNTLWPSYRGKRAGRLVRERERERVSMKQIAVVSTRKVSSCPWFSAPLHCHNSADSCERKTLLFEQIIKTGLDHVMPMRTRKVHSTEPPWITSSLMNLLQKRQSASSRGDDQMFGELRNRVDRERKMCRANYYQAKVQHLKKCKPSEWCKEVKKLSGCSLPFTA